MSDEKKNEIKDEIINKINNILIENDIPEIHNLTVINLNNQTSFLGNIAVLDYNKLDKVENQLNKLFKEYSSYSVRTEEVISCCKPAYKNISFKININK